VNIECEGWVLFAGSSVEFKRGINALIRDSKESGVFK